MSTARVPAQKATRVPFQVADCFVLALDDFMRRTRQGGHVSQSVLELDRPPDLARLRLGCRRAVAKHPLLVATPSRHAWTRLPYWSVPPPPERDLPLGIWKETGVDSGWEDATPVRDARELLESVMNESLRTDGIHFNARVDLVHLRSGGCLAALSWSHLLLDGKGAELLLTELSRLCDGIDVPDSTEARERPVRTLVQKFRQTKPAMDHLTKLQATGVPSLGGPKARRGRGRYEVITLNTDDSDRVRKRIEAMGVALFPFTFYVACVARAHDRIFEHRGIRPRGYGISVPIQTRRRGSQGPIFHNHVAVLYFHPRREHLSCLEDAVAAMKTQFADMTRARISESFDAVLDLMRPVPTFVFLWIIRAQFKGEICTCFHSYTGTFAPDLMDFAGGRVINAYHLPCLGTPPGTGIFVGDRDGRINVTISWREGALSNEERELMITQLNEDLLAKGALKTIA